jgi:glycosyltransferase involved in cell wall biosynthesis
MTISITAIIPTHKRPDLLKRSIQSILNQTKLPSEILIIDDAGCKETAEVVYEFKLDFLSYIHNEEGQGASSSRNLGARIAKGEFVAFLDDDDEWLPTKLEKQSNLIKKNHLDACFSQIQIKYENTNISYSTKAKKRKNYVSDILMENYIGGTISSVIRKQAFIDVGGFDLKYKAREEYDLWIKLITSNYLFDIVEEPLAIAYRSLEERQRISANINNYVTSIDRLNDKYLNAVNLKLSDKQKKLREKMQYDFLAAQAVSIGLRKDALIYYYKSIFVKPSFKAVIGLFLSAISPSLLIKIRAKL